MDEDKGYEKCILLKINLGEGRTNFKKDIEKFWKINRTRLQSDRDVKLQDHQITLYDTRIDGNEEFENCVVRYFMRNDDLYAIAVATSRDDGVNFTPPYEMHDRKRADGTERKLVLKNSLPLEYGFGYEKVNWDKYNGLNYDTILAAFQNLMNTVGKEDLKSHQVEEQAYSNHVLIQLVTESARNVLVTNIYDDILNHKRVIDDMLTTLVMPFFWQWEEYSKEARKAGSRGELTVIWEDLVILGDITEYIFDLGDMRVEDLTEEDLRKLYNYRIICNKMITMKHQQASDFKGTTYNFCYYDKELKVKHKKEKRKTSICLLNCGPTGYQTLKNLLLNYGGIGRITVVDDSEVKHGDLEDNFLGSKSSLGQSKAECVRDSLRELDDTVKATCIEMNPVTFIKAEKSFFHQFTLVIATQLVEDSMVKLECLCRAADVMLVFARSYGDTGFVRTSVNAYALEPKPDQCLDDLRLKNPWPELKMFTENIDFDTFDHVAHKETSYIFILVKVAQEWANVHGGIPPSTIEEEKEFQELIKTKMSGADEENIKEAIEASIKVFAPTGISSSLKRIIDDPCAHVQSGSSDLWVMVAALKEFIENEGEVPLVGSIPKMRSSTELYVNLQELYQAKAEADFLSFKQRVRCNLENIGRGPNSISKSVIQSFCKNARNLTVCKFKHIKEEFSSPNLTEMQKYIADKEYRMAVEFYFLLRAVDRFCEDYNTFPGQIDGATFEDIPKLKTTASNLLSNLGCNDFNLGEDLIEEMCRHRAAESHEVAACIGKVASQEAIKLIKKQIVPMTGTFIFDGIDNNSQWLSL